MKFLLVASLLAVALGQNATSFDQCSATDYYAPIIASSGADPLGWSKAELAALVTDTHRNVLPNTAPIQGGDDILRALTDLDPGDAPGETVRLLYRDISYPATPAGDPNTWRREDLWPIARGASRDSPALTDVHSKKPADSTVLLKKDRLFFGLCGTVENDGACSRPATTETAIDTEQDDKIFGPPVMSRGEVARALFYTQLRYEESLGLTLSDCPPFSSTEFGYLSQLLEWHIADPVTPEEIARNNQACSRWQGNRNPFVDFPELVELYFDKPDTILEGAFIYSKCTVPTSSPTATPNECSSLEAGDIPLFLYNSDNPDQVVFFPLKDIPASVGSLFVTDNAWNGDEFLSDEGILEFIIPEDGIPAGQSFGYGENSPFAEQWEVVSDGPFDFGINGDQVFIYCVDADDLPNILFAFSNTGNWSDPGLAEYGPDESALPDKVAGVGSLVLPHQDNCNYQGITTGYKSDLLTAFVDPENWVCSDNSRFNLDLPSAAWMSRTVVALVLAPLVLLL